MRRLIPHYLLKQAGGGLDHGELLAHTMFIDISGFTAMTHTLMQNGKEGAEVLTEVINNVFTPAIDAIYAGGGFISTFAGDAFSAVFPGVDAAPDAVLLAARQIRASFAASGNQQTKFGVFNLTVKIGLSGGDITWRILRNPHQDAYFFRGAAVDGAAHSEHACDTGDIVFDSHFQEAVPATDCKQRGDGHWLLTLGGDVPAVTAMELPPVEDCSAFMPATVINQVSRGEFRDIIACFLSFREAPGWIDSISRVIALTHEFGGYFNKIDFGDKGGVALVLFGAPIGREKLAERSLSFALAVRDIPEFDVRMGVTYGSCFTGFVGSERRCEYTAIGMVVNLAARYMMKAPWGEVHVDRFLNKDEHERFEMDFLSEEVFKGFSEPISVYLLRDRHTGVQEINFEGETIGRESEVAQLRKTLDPLRNGHFGGIVYIDGVAGIGKSRLIWQLRQELDPDEMSWFYLPCDEVLRKSFNPVEHWLRVYFQLSEQGTQQANLTRFENVLYVLRQTTEDPDIARELERTSSLLGALVGLYWPGSLYERLDAQGRYENTMDALKNLVKAESRLRPVVLEIDDGHWVDSESREFLSSLCRQIENYPIMLLVASRFNDDGSDFDLDIEHAPAQRIRLGELESENTKKLLLDRLRMVTGKVVTDLPQNTFDLIWTKSEGNPFFLEQILLYLLENDKLDDNYALTQRDLEIPSQINAIIIARIDRLTDDIKETIKTASVLGKEFLLSILSGMLHSLDVRFDLSHLDQLIEKGENENIWNPVHEIRYIFKHALVRESVYEIQLKQRLRMLHGLAALTMEKLYKDDLVGHYADLAFHFDTAENHEKATIYTKLAGQQAKHGFQNQQALHFYTRHMELLYHLLGCPGGDLAHIEVAADQHDKAVDLFNALLDRKYMLQLLGNTDEARDMVQAALVLAEKLRDDEILGKAHLDRANLLKTLGQYDEAGESLEQALEYFGRSGNQLMIGMAHLDRGIIRFFTGKRQEAFDDFQCELEIFQSLDDKKRTAEALGNLGVIYRYIGEPEKAMSYLRRQLAIATDIDDKIEIARGQSNIGWVFEAQGDLAQALDFYERSLAGNRELGLKAEIVRLLDNIGYVNQQLDQHRKALEYHHAALEMAAETGDADSMVNITINTGHAHKALGDYAKTEACYDEAAAMIKKYNMRYALPELLIEKAGLYFLLERYVEAKRLNDEGLAVAEDIGSAEFIEKGRALREKIDNNIQ
ncbi:MAG: tetratricopeptide repeat protein [Candidatus Cloacimonetes bacterium]|nr:tetratricopeptide repeat protein [Candidatus Cloacimonadota bacterium]